VRGFLPVWIKDKDSEIFDFGPKLVNSGAIFQAFCSLVIPLSAEKGFTFGLAKSLLL